MVRAFVYSRRGEPSKTLNLIEKYEVPSIKNGQVRIKVAAVGLNPVDWKLMKYVPGFIGKRPAVAASDYSGTVLESKSELFKAGDEVYGIVHSSVKIATGLGSLADEIIAPANACAHRPENIDAVHAAGISLVGLTAVVLARHADQSAERASTNNRQKRVCKAKDHLVLERGADVTFDYRQERLSERLIEHVKVHRSFDSILDCADAFDVWQSCDKILNSNGSYTNVGMDLTQGLLPALRKLVSYFLRPIWLGGVPRAYSRSKEIATRENMDELSEFINRGVIKPLIDSEYSFENSIEAFEHLMSNKATGKVIIRV